MTSWRVSWLVSSPHLGFFCWHKLVSQCPHGKFNSIPQFVAEVAIAQDAVDVQVDISS